MHNIILVSVVQHSDSTIICYKMLTPISVVIICQHKKNYSIIDCIPYVVLLYP